MDQARLVEFRRTVHRNAEPGFCEIGTAARIEAALDGLPVEVRLGADAQDLSGVANPPGRDERDHWARLAMASGVARERAEFFRDHGTALVVELAGNRPGPVWGLRTDIDALPMREADDPRHFPARQGFHATNGAMHACGHDCHATMGVGLLHRMADRDFPGTLRVFFQPAEEGVRGAQTMIEAGVVDGVDRMLAIHVSGGEPMSKVMGSGTGGMATQKLLVTFDGLAAHASGAPEHGRNALAAAAMATLGILGLPRFHAADTRLNVGTLHAGDNVNIIPAHAVLTCEARAADDEILLDLAARVRRVIEGAAAAHGVDSAVQVTGQAPTLAPDEGLIDLVVAAAGEVGGVASVARTVRQAGSDDANTMIRLVQSRGGTGAYVRVGASSPAPHHNPFFDVEEAAIGTGIDVLEQLLRRG